MRSRVWSLFVVAVLLAAAPAAFSGGHDLTTVMGDSQASELTRPAQAWIVRTTGGIDTTGWVLIAVLHGPDAELVRKGQLVRAFSVNARTRMHTARVTRVRTEKNGVRVEATLETRVLGVPTRYLMEIVTESI